MMRVPGDGQDYLSALGVFVRDIADDHAKHVDAQRRELARTDNMIELATGIVLGVSIVMLLTWLSL